jgi:methionyl-tRNA formyltransferase
MLYKTLKKLFSVAKDDKIILFGSGKVAFPSLQELHKKYQNLQVVTQSSHNQKKVFN